MMRGSGKVAAAAQCAARKTPQRRASMRKLDQILVAATQLLDDYTVSEISIAMLADRSGISRTTIYDFFPSVLAVYEQVAQQHVAESYDFMLSYLKQTNPRELFAVVDTLVDAAVEYFNGNSAARKTLLGTGALEMHLIVDDFEGLCAQLYHRAYVADWPILRPGPRDPFRNLATIQSALYTNSVQRHGIITDYMAEQVKAAGRGYLREILDRSLPEVEAQYAQ